jgi:hypothetical protein
LKPLPGEGRKRVLMALDFMLGLNEPTKRARKPRRPTLASIAAQASKAAIEIARYVVKSDSIDIVTGKGEPAEPENPWLAELHRKETKK